MWLWFSPSSFFITEADGVSELLRHLASADPRPQVQQQQRASSKGEYCSSRSTAEEAPALRCRLVAQQQHATQQRLGALPQPTLPTLTVRLWHHRYAISPSYPRPSTRTSLVQEYFLLSRNGKSSFLVSRICNDNRHS